MSSSGFMQQFLYSFQHMLTGVHGVINLTTEVKATLITQAITLTAASFGTVGNNVTFTVTGGATAGAEVVTVTGNNISVQVESGTSTVTQVATALSASTAAVALAVTTSTGSSKVSTHAVQSLSGGVNGVVSSSIPGVSSVVQTGVGEITVTLTDLFNAATFIKAMIVSATAQDLIPQVKSETVGSTKIIVIRLLTGATATDPTSDCQLYLMDWMRNTGVSN